MAEKQFLVSLGLVILVIITYFKKNNILSKKKSSFKTPSYLISANEPKSTSSITLLKENAPTFLNKFEDNIVQRNNKNDSLFPSSLDYNRAYGELINFGCKPSLDGSKQVVRLSKSLDGRWFYCRKSGFNTQRDRIYLILNKMPYLQTLLLKIELNDPLLKIQGGRVLISLNGHYRKNIISSQLDSILVN